jgi:hypothetical protein
MIIKPGALYMEEALGLDSGLVAQGYVTSNDL